MADEKEILGLIEQLQNRKTRGKAAKELVKMGEASVPYLINAYEDPDICERINSILVKIRKPAIPYLIKALKNEDEHVRAWSLISLGNIGSKGEDISAAIPALIDALNDESILRISIRNDAVFELRVLVEKKAEKGDYSAALKIIKDSTEEVRKLPDKQVRREVLGKLATITQEIYGKMNPDKKTFHKPVKHQSVRTVRKKVIRSG